MHILVNSTEARCVDSLVGISKPKKVFLKEKYARLPVGHSLSGNSQHFSEKVFYVFLNPESQEKSVKKLGKWEVRIKIWQLKFNNLPEDITGSEESTDIMESNTCWSSW